MRGPTVRRPLARVASKLPLSESIFVGQRDSLVMVGMFSGRGTALDQFGCSALLILGSGSVSCRARLCEYLAERRLGRDPDPSRNGDENPPGMFKICAGSN
jgi:hypothetical protein